MVKYWVELELDIEKEFPDAGISPKGLGEPKVEIYTGDSYS
jgi:hypothetical protein